MFMVQVWKKNEWAAHSEFQAKSKHTHCVEEAALARAEPRGVHATTF